MNQTIIQVEKQPQPLTDEELAMLRQSPFYSELLRLLAKYILLAKERREKRESTQQQIA